MTKSRTDHPQPRGCELTLSGDVACTDCTDTAANPPVRENRASAARDNEISILLNSGIIDELMEWKRTREHTIAKRIQANLSHTVYPIIEILRESASPRQENLLSLLKSCLNDIVSPLTHKLQTKYSNLSPRELEICHMVGDGYSTKQIATLKCISETTVSDHRKSIRRKLGLTGSNTQLSSYLNSHKNPRS